MLNDNYIPHVSLLDASINFERTFTDHTGRIEARYVQRTPEYFIVYLSSQTGCEQACRMCWLTQTGQNDSRDVTVEEYFEQADIVLAEYERRWVNNITGTPTDLVHFNFMARGEPLANQIFLENADLILNGLKDRATKLGLKAKFKISTIMPKALGSESLLNIFRDPEVYPDIYYSLYSTEIAFRRKWLPKAMNCGFAFGDLKRWADHTKKVPKIHYAFIEGENDSPEEIYRITSMIHAYDIPVAWNVVRYNPHPKQRYKEPPEDRIQVLANLVEFRLGIPVKIVSRVGIDVQASCGTFLN